MAKKTKKKKNSKPASRRSTARPKAKSKQKPKSTPKAKAKSRKKTVSRSAPARVKARPESAGRSSLLASLDAGTLGRRHRRARSAGQAGDTQGLPRMEDIDSESVEELLEEGQSFEAGVLSGVEDAEANSGEVRTREVLEDDVPGEYLDED